jgi:hypothetical protein
MGITMFRVGGKSIGKRGIKPVTKVINRLITSKSQLNRQRAEPSGRRENGDVREVE